MNETPKINWPGIRKTNDGKHSFSLNIGNRTYIEGEFYDEESAARGYDQAKYALLQTGHLQRANFYHFPVEVASWQNGEKNTPQPCSALLTFMRENPPRYVPYSQRQVEEEQNNVEKAEQELEKAEKKLEREKRALTAALPSPPKLFAAHQTLTKLLAATPQRLTAAQQDACKTVLEILNALWSTL